MSFGSDTIDLSAGGFRGVSLKTSEVVINDLGNAGVDFRVESNTDTHQIFSDSGTEKVGIGTSLPTHKLTVEGDISASSTVFAGLFTFNDRKFASPSSVDDVGINLGNGGDGNLLLTNLTASNNISASADILANRFLLPSGGGALVNSNVVILGDIIGSSDPQVEIRRGGNTTNAGGRLIIGDDNLEFTSGGTSVLAVDSTLTHVKTTLRLNSVANETSDPDKFLVIDGSGDVKYRTGAEVASDIGATGTVTEVSVNTGLDVTNATTHPTISLDLQEIGQATQVMPSTDFFVAVRLPQIQIDDIYQGQFHLVYLIMMGLLKRLHPLHKKYQGHLIQLKVKTQQYYE